MPACDTRSHLDAVTEFGSGHEKKRKMNNVERTVYACIHSQLLEKETHEKDSNELNRFFMIFFCCNGERVHKTYSNKPLQEKNKHGTKQNKTMLRRRMHGFIHYCVFFSVFIRASSICPAHHLVRLVLAPINIWIWKPRGCHSVNIRLGRIKRPSLDRELFFGSI